MRCPPALSSQVTLLDLTVSMILHNIPLVEARMTRGTGGRSVQQLIRLLKQWYIHAQRIFHMLVGLVFFVLALAGTSVSFAEWRYYQQAPSVGLVRFGLLVGFTVLLFFFGFYSLAKARSVR